MFHVKTDGDDDEVATRMSNLVGKDLELPLPSLNVTAMEETDEEEEGSPSDAHAALSPPSSAEALFMDGLKTSDVSANFIATEIQRNYRPIRSLSTTNTDDFVSAFDNMDDLNNNIEQRSRGFFGFKKQPIHEYNEEDTDNMSAKTTAEYNTENVSVDAASHVYEGVKNVWGWGKEQIVISTFLGMTEAVAGKVVSIVGTDFEEIDHNITPQLSNFDSNILNPAIRAVLGIVMNVAGKSENFLKPIIVSVLKPVGLLKDDKEKTAPELTNARMAGRVN